MCWLRFSRLEDQTDLLETMFLAKYRIFQLEQSLIVTQIKIKIMTIWKVSPLFTKDTPPLKEHIYFSWRKAHNFS